MAVTDDPWGDGEPTVDLTLHESVRNPIMIRDRARAERFSRFVAATCALIDRGDLTDAHARALWERALFEATRGDDP